MNDMRLKWFWSWFFVNFAAHLSQYVTATDFMRQKKMSQKWKRKLETLEKLIYLQSDLCVRSKTFISYVHMYFGNVSFVFFFKQKIKLYSADFTEPSFLDYKINKQTDLLIGKKEFQERSFASQNRSISLFSFEICSFSAWKPKLELKYVELNILFVDFFKLEIFSLKSYWTSLVYNSGLSSGQSREI